MNWNVTAMSVAMPSLVGHLLSSGHSRCDLPVAWRAHWGPRRAPRPSRGRVTD